MLYDLFICHASEDKDDFVRPLAEALQKQHVEVWYDEFSLKLGDSIRRAINKGLSQARFGIVVLSESFFKKKWTQYELDGLTERENSSSDIIILPIWHKISHAEIMNESPPLAGKKAISSSEGIKKIVNKIIEVIHPQGSPLIQARDIVLEWGLEPPVVTDKYWLEIVEASNRSPAYGAIVPEESIWDRWSFPLPDKSEGPEAWGERLAWTAMQLNWVKSAEEIPITPLTPPNIVWEFIESHPGLLETCQTYPDLTAEYAPQLTIPEFSNSLHGSLENAYQKSLAKSKKTLITSPHYGTDLTTNRKGPLCDEEWSLRHPSFGNYDTVHVAQAYFNGGMFGPRVSPYEYADHLIWLLSDKSNWLPENIKSCLLDGMIKSHAWPWGDFAKNSGEVWKHCGKLFKSLYKCIDEKNRATFKYTREIKEDILGRVTKAKIELKLKDSSKEILNRFMTLNVAEQWIEYENNIKKRRNK